MRDANGTDLTPEDAEAERLAEQKKIDDGMFFLITRIHDEAHRAL